MARAGRLAAILLVLLAGATVTWAAPAGEVTRAVHVSLAPTWTTLHRLQQLMHERVMFAPIIEPAFLNGVGPRLPESGLGLITSHPYSSPYENLRLKAK